MIKQVMTPERANRIQRSVQYMLIMAEMIKMEHASDMDTRFKNPMANQFASRIANDAKAIQTHLLTNDKVKVQVTDYDFVEEYAGELFRVFHFFIGLPLSNIKTVMDNLHSLAQVTEE